MRGAELIGIAGTAVLLLSQGGAEAQTVATGTRREVPIADTPVATEVLTRADFEREGARTVDEALDMLPGVEIVRSFNGSSIYLQGLGPEYVLVLVDGQRMVGRVSGAIDLSRLGLENVERIEVVKGPASALYGSDAIGGVVNIITRQADAALVADGSLSIGSFAQLDATAHLGSRGKRWHLALTGGWHVTDGYDRDPATVDTTAAAGEEGTAALRAGYKGTNGFRANAAVEYVRRDQRAVSSSPTGAIFDRANATETTTARSSVTVKPGAPTKLELSAHASFFRDQYLSDQRNASALDRLEETRELWLQLGSQLEWLAPARHYLTFGAEGALERLESDRLDDGDGDRQRLGLLAQDEWTIVEEPRLVAVPAVRLDADSQFGLHVSPKLAVRLDPHRDLTVRAALGWGFRAPDFKELYLHFENPGVGYVVDGNPDLAPETSRSVSAGVEWRATPDLTLTAGYYRNDLDDLVTTQLVDDGSTDGTLRFGYVNVAAAWTQGAEGSLRLRLPRGFSLGGTYALTFSRDESSGERLEGRSLHRGRVELGWHHARWGISVDTAAAFVGPAPYFVDDDGDGMTSRTFSDRYVDLSARLAKTFHQRFSLFVRLDNAADVEGRFLTLPPRALRVGLTARY
jgi:outer membrane receptor for ferrienterochelin and colicins